LAISFRLKKGGIEIGLLSSKVLHCYLPARKPGVGVFQGFQRSCGRSQQLKKVLARTEVFCQSVKQTHHHCGMVVFKGADFCFVFLGICPSGLSF